ncbi:hypothetical protein P872_18200 [Rhodonellum psychrophilum GCM71 = DSM 17998]|uniref:Lysine transporter LysE n=2 Tax=Rhodonellum TaxID=336827 RepID=U5BPF6_9BACT|nr:MULTISPECIES: LysE family transporter [Rhodonellum]ERM82445.1 hypothetical protein P872_18200 [Rhodonellum psychrophilum GCM71 = DSM 17998]SDY87710.1 Threonine/homoserine/homoserine lactone efflux protein [Rhodonellum ikkaensis]
MSQALLEGLSMGMILSAMIGPVFFTLIQSSIESGFRYAAIVALGIFTSDLLYVVITYFGVSLFVQNPMFEIVLGYFGGVVLIGFGVVTFFKKAPLRPNSGGIPIAKPLKKMGFLKGFGINGINPFVLLFWISIAGLVNLKSDFRKVDVFVYYTGLLLTVFSIDLLKAYIAKQLRPLVTPKVMKNLNRVTAVVLVVFGIRLFKYALDKHLLLT